MSTLLEVRSLRRDVADRNILTNISFTLDPGQILFVRGPSGVGKSLLLRALACLDPVQGGTLLLNGSPPSQVGFPAWRTAVSYVPQSRASSLRGTPAELYFQAQRFAAQRSRPRGDLPALVHALGLEQPVLNQQWGELSGGQAQRVALAISVALGPWVLLLDEPTSACDPLAVLRVERMLASCGAALVWVTHDPHQPARVGGRILELPLATVVHLPQPALLPPLPPVQLSAAGVAATRGGAGGGDAAAADPSSSGGGPGGGLGSGGGGPRGPGSKLDGLLDSGSSSLAPTSSPALLPLSRPAELLENDADVYGMYGYPDVLSDSSLLSPPSPSQLRGPRGVP